MKRLLGLMCALLAALVALLGHWLADPRPVAVETPPAADGGGLDVWPWLSGGGALLAVAAGIAVVVRRRRALPAATTRPQHTAARPPAPRWWLVIIRVDGAIQASDYVRYAAADLEEMRAETLRRVQEAIGGRLRPGARVTVQVAPATAEAATAARAARSAA